MPFKSDLRKNKDKRYNSTTFKKTSLKTTQKQAKKPLKYKTYKQKKLEDSRWSVFTTNLDDCIVCEMPKDDINEVFMGCDRSNSIKYGFCIPLCRKCHDEFHNNIKMQQLWIRRCKEYFINEIGSEEEFIKIFHPKNNA